MEQKLGSILGFSAWFNTSVEQGQSARAARERALGPFKHLETKTLTFGGSTVELWGHREISNRMHRFADGSLLALIGSPLGEVSWQELEQALSSDDSFARFKPPWDGRFNLLHVSADGKRWTMWNDWLGSIPVFHAQLSGGRVASTIEPVTVAAAGYTPDDFFLPSLLFFLIHGNFFSDWTLYDRMKTVAPDCRAQWGANDFQFSRSWTVTPSQDRWEARWDDLVDEMHELATRAVTEALKQDNRWIIPLSSGLDSRLIAGVGAKAGVELQTYAWGEANSTDVVYSRQVARTLGLPWKHIQLRGDFLRAYTQSWANWYGSAMHFHGMYQMCFLDAIRSEPQGRMLSGFVGEVLAGDGLVESVIQQSRAKSYQLEDEWFTLWEPGSLKFLLRDSVEDALEAVAREIQCQLDLTEAARFQRLMMMQYWSRQRCFTSFNSTLYDYWRGVATPFHNRAYARFCLSLPRAALDQRRLLGDVFRRYFGYLAVIPGSYAREPFILTGRYLLNRRISTMLPSFLRRGPFASFDKVPLRMDFNSAQRLGKAAFWPLFDAWELLAARMNMDLVEQDFQTVMRSKQDDRPLRRLQTLQMLAFRLLDSTKP